MNQLSWTLYWADILPRISLAMCIVFFMLAFVSLCAMVYHFIYRNETRGDWVRQHIVETMTREERFRVQYTDDARAAQGFWWTKWTFPLCLLVWGLTFLVPSKETFYLIAASQAGEQAIQTPEFGKVRQVINKWLDDAASPEEKSNDD